MINQIIVHQVENKIYSLCFDAQKKLIQVIYDTINEKIGGIYLAKVVSVNTKNNTAFLEYAENQVGFLNYKPQYTNIQAGSKLIVQLEWLGNNEKLPKLTNNYKLIGKYAILNRTGNGNKYSYQLNNEMQAKLKENFSHYNHYNLTYRSKIAQCNDIDLIDHELNKLVMLHDFILKDANQYNPPRKLFAGFYNFEICLNSLDYAQQIEIVTNNEIIFNTIEQASYKVSLNKEEELDIQDMINHALNQIHIEFSLHLHRVSGINLIDLDNNNLPLNGFQTNYLAIDEIVKLIRIHDLTGIILIDMIKNISIKQETMIYESFVNKLKNTDWRNCQILGFTKAGIFEIIRSKS